MQIPQVVRRVARKAAPRREPSDHRDGTPSEDGSAAPLADLRARMAQHLRERDALGTEALLAAGMSEEDAEKFLVRGMPQSMLFMVEIIPVLHRLYADLPSHATKTVLDVGPQNFAGTALLSKIHGQDTWTHLKLEVSAIDIVDRFAHLKELVAPEVEFIHGNVFDLKAGSFDVVIASHVVEHVPDPEAFVRQLQLVARDHVVIATPWQEDLPLTTGHCNVIDPTFVDAVGGQGLQVYKNYSWGKQRSVCIFSVEGRGWGFVRKALAALPQDAPESDLAEIRERVAALAESNSPDADSEEWERQLIRALLDLGLWDAARDLCAEAPWTGTLADGIVEVGQTPEGRALGRAFLAARVLPAYLERSEPVDEQPQDAETLRRLVRVLYSEDDLANQPAAAQHLLRALATDDQAAAAAVLGSSPLRLALRRIDGGPNGPRLRIFRRGPEHDALRVYVERGGERHDLPFTTQDDDNDSFVIADLGARVRGAWSLRYAATFGDVVVDAPVRFPPFLPPVQEVGNVRVEAVEENDPAVVARLTITATTSVPGRLLGKGRRAARSVARRLGV